MAQYNDIMAALHSSIDPLYREKVSYYFKTGPNEYGEGDRFIGVRVPNIRQIAKAFSNVSWEDIKTLLYAEVHEERFLALCFLTKDFLKEKEKRKAIFDFYMKHIDQVNNWDLVDISAPAIVGGYLYGSDHSILFRLATSKKLWHRRIAIVAMLYAVRKGKELGTTNALATILRNDQQGLIQKAVGWVLREVAKKDSDVTKAFLDQYAAEMPRTMLRYSLERFPADEKNHYIGQAALQKRRDARL